MDIILIILLPALFFALSFVLVWMVTDTIKKIFDDHQKNNVDHRIINEKTIDALNSIAEALKHVGKMEQPSNDRVVNDNYSPQSAGHAEAEQIMAHRVRADVTTSAEEAGIAAMVFKSVKSPVAFGQEE